MEVSTKSALELAHDWTRQWDLPAEAEYRPDHGQGTLYPHKLSLESFVAGYEAALPQWISVEDRLPAVLEAVIVLYAPTNAARNDHRMECWNWPEGELNEIKYITHWMPLPAPPSGG